MWAIVNGLVGLSLALGGVRLCAVEFPDEQLHGEFRTSNCLLQLVQHWFVLSEVVGAF